ncbi:hypothetical protein K523DRAFT_134464 [Schizophyllum commune Tattone D]|nr:hypothetical protein K523DRAFT_134464 [Schizophyllum commune Tattone D]
MASGIQYRMHGVGQDAQASTGRVRCMSELADAVHDAPHSSTGHQSPGRARARVNGLIVRATRLIGQGRQTSRIESALVGAACRPCRIREGGDIVLDNPGRSRQQPGRVAYMRYGDSTRGPSRRACIQR